MSKGSLKAEFLGDGRGRLFTNLFAKNLNAAVNHGNSDSILNTPAYDVMVARNYTERKVPMNDNDIHYEFTDFIVNAALFHRELDKPTSASGAKAKLCDAIDSAVDKFFSNRPNRNRPVQPNQANAGVDLAPIMEADLAPIMEVNANAENPFENAQANRAAAAVGRDQLAADVANVVPPPNANFVPPNAANAANAAAIQLGGDAGEFAQEIVESVFNDDTVKKILTELATHAKSNNMFIAPKAKAIGSLTDMFKAMKGTKSTSKQVSGAIKKHLCDTLPLYFNVNYSDLSNPHAKKLWNAIYASWDSQPEDVKAFYRAFLSVYTRVQGGAWKRVENDAYAAVNTSDDKNVRFNLNKDGYGNIQFINIIPLVPSTVTTVWYTNASGNIVKLKDMRGPIEEDERIRRTEFEILRVLYYLIYTDHEDLKNYAPDLPKSYDEQRSMKFFHIDVDKLVRQRLAYNRSQPVDAPAKADEQMVDLAYNNIWHRGADGELYTKGADGSKIPVSDMNKLSQKASCFGTGVDGSNATCLPFVFDCILSNDAKKLEACMEGLKNVDFKKFADNELKNLHPKVAAKILNKFGFQQVEVYDREQGKVCNKVQSVNAWQDAQVKKDQSMKDKLDANPNLIKYLGLIVEFVNANLAVLNKNGCGSTDESVGRPPVPSFAAKAKINLRIDPFKAESGLYDMGVLKGYNQTNLYGATIRNPLLRSSTGQYTTNSVSFMPAFMSGRVSVGQTGGGAVDDAIRRKQLGSAQRLSGLFKAALVQMKSRNKTLDESNRIAIDKKIERLAKMEEELIKQARDIETYSECLDALRDYKSETLNYENLKTIVDRCNSLYTKHGCEEQSIVKVIECCQKISANVPTPEVSEVKGREINPNDI